MTNQKDKWEKEVLQKLSDMGHDNYAAEDILTFIRENFVHKDDVRGLKFKTDNDFYGSNRTKDANYHTEAVFNSKIDMLLGATYDKPKP